MTALLNAFSQSAFFRGVFVIIKLIWSIVTVLLATGLVIAYIKSRPMRPTWVVWPKQIKKTKQLQNTMIKDRWAAVVKKFAIGTPEAARVSVIEADAVVDAVLKSNMQLPGEHLADRLSNLASDQVKSLDRVWRAHRIRNELVHTPGFILSINDAHKALEDYEAFLKEVGIL